MKYFLSILAICVLAVACNKNETSTETRETVTIQNAAVPEQKFNRIIAVVTPRMEGEDVLELQNRLLSLGFGEVGEADGYYGPATEGVIKNIQSLSGFESNGKVDKTFWDFILDDKNDVYLRLINKALLEGNIEIEGAENFSRIIELVTPNMTGQDISSLHSHLNVLGFSGLDNVYDQSTETVIKNIQTFSGFEPDGKVNKELWDYIFNSKNILFLRNISTVLAYDSMKLIQTSELLLGGFVADSAPFAYIDYSAADNKAKKLEYYFTPAGGTHKWTCYFINNNHFYMKYEYFKYIFDDNDEIKTEEEIYLSIDNNPFDIIKGNLQPSGGKPGQDKKVMIETINKILKSVLDKNGDVPPDEQTENGFTVARDGRLIKHSFHDTRLTIPAGIGSVQVTAIFPDPIFRDKGLESVIIPGSITRIVDRAFAENPLSSITIGADVSLGEQIGNDIGDPPYYSFDIDFDDFYDNNGKRAGTYVLNEGAWEYKQ